ncbi:MAG: hypothetical protein L3K15_03670 [Thermoplasmata archaeon]|nr:hypothetical protein [Thermoplasmata archaeon]
MSGTPPTSENYGFYSFVRQGLAATITTPPVGGAVPLRYQLQVEIDLSGQPLPGASNPTRAPVTTVSLVGPGDVVGVHPNQFIRSEPKDGTPSFESNRLAAVELSDASFPWIFTPAGPDSAGRLLPWVALLVLESSEFQLASGSQPLPSITITDPTALPPLSESWAWAHVQVTGGTGGSPLSSLLNQTPSQVFSRVISPRALSEGTSYSAFLVPAFDATAQVGLGNPLPTGTTTTGPAWNANTKPGLRLPFYYSFAFQATASGDFESLVRRLRPTPLTGLHGVTVGARPMDVSNPGTAWGVSSAADAGTVQLGGALRPLGGAPPEWPSTGDVHAATFQTNVQTLLQESGATPATSGGPGPDPAVAPPIYGGDFVYEPTTHLTNEAVWFPQLNLDPRWRGLAGIGSKVVQSHATMLLAAAWQQYPGLREANHVLRHSQFSFAVVGRMLSKHLGRLPSASQIALTAGVHGQLRLRATIAGVPTTITVHAALPLAGINAPFVSPATRRVMRPSGSLWARQGVTFGTSPQVVIARLSYGRITLVPPARVLGALATGASNLGGG